MELHYDMLVILYNFGNLHENIWKERRKRKGANRATRTETALLALILRTRGLRQTAEPRAPPAPALPNLSSRLGPLSLVGFSVQEPDWGPGLGAEGLQPGYHRPFFQPQRWADGTHHGEAAPVLPDDGAKAQEASHHDEGAGEDEDVGRGGEGAGGQDAEVAALLHQGPHAHGQDGGPAHLQKSPNQNRGRGGGGWAQLPFSELHPQHFLCLISFNLSKRL